MGFICKHDRVGKKQLIHILKLNYHFFKKIYLYIYHNSASLASLTRETGPKVVKGDPARKAETPKVSSHDITHHYAAPTFSTSDSSLKFTHILYNLSPAGIYFIFLFNSYFPLYFSFLLWLYYNIHVISVWFAYI